MAGQAVDSVKPKAGIDVNTILLSILAVALMGWIVWSSLPAAVAPKTWLMELTSRGYKLNSFHTAVEQMNVVRAPGIAKEQFRTLYGSQISMIEVPWRQVGGATFNGSLNELRVELAARPWRHSQGSRAVVLAKWAEDKFPGTLRTYAIAVPDGPDWPVTCIRAFLPTDEKAGAAFLEGASVRFVFAPASEVETRVESGEAAAGFVSSQAFLMGVDLRSVSIVGPDGIERALPCR
jgi:hypothetical protein